MIVAIATIGVNVYVGAFFWKRLLHGLFCINGNHNLTKITPNDSVI